jgi:hypothetical protein
VALPDGEVDDSFHCEELVVALALVFAAVDELERESVFGSAVVAVVV